MADFQGQQVPKQPVPGDLPTAPTPPVSDPTEDPTQQPPPVQEPDVFDPTPSPERPPMIARR